MVWICDECKRGRHGCCESSIRCDCQCNINGAADVTQKVLATAGGVGMALGGLALTIFSGGLLIPVGGAMMGAGISSTFQGVEKTIKRERINGVGFCADVAFGAATGVLTGGIGAAGEAVAINVVKQGAKEVAMVGAKKLAVRTTAGAVAGVVSKAVDEIKECTTTNKSWSDFGQTIDENGDVKGTATAASWIMSAAVGGLGGVGGHISSNATKQVSSGIIKSGIRVGVSGATAVVSDTAVQTVNIAAGNQEEFDFKRTATTFAASSITTAAFEGAQNGLYRLNGGKDQILLDKANKEMLQKEGPKGEKQEILKSYKKLKGISPTVIEREAEKTIRKPKLLKERIKWNAKTSQLNEQIREVSDLLNIARQANDQPAIIQHAQDRNILLQKRTQFNIKRNRLEGHIQRNTREFLNDQNAHILTGQKTHQIAVDINPPSGNHRGSERAVFDYEINHDKNRLEYKFAGYTSTHDYNSIPNHGQSNYQNYHENQTNNLRHIRQGNNLMIHELCAEDEED